MGVRAIILSLFVLGVIILIHRERAQPRQQFYFAESSPSLETSPGERPHYYTGKFNSLVSPKINLLDTITRKKINSYVFNHYNQYRIQITLVDLGYTSNLLFSFFSEENGAFKFEEKIGFDLPEVMDEFVNVHVNKPRFKFTMRQHQHPTEQMVLTTFNLTSQRRYSNVTLNLTHILRSEECFTAIRTGDVISHKCYGGYGEGKVRIERYIPAEDVKRNSIFNPSWNLTRCMFDGLRGSGMHWHWFWAEASGFSKPEFYAGGHKIAKERWLGLNFGSIAGEGEDFVFLNGEVIPVKGLQYSINDDFELNSVVIFTAEEPKLNANFTILDSDHIVNDLGPLKLDMRRAQGNWAGQIEDIDGTKIQFYLIAGLIQTSDSLF